MSFNGSLTELGPVSSDGEEPDGEEEGEDVSTTSMPALSTGGGFIGPISRSGDTIEDIDDEETDTEPSPDEDAPPPIENVQEAVEREEATFTTPEPTGSSGDGGGQDGGGDDTTPTPGRSAASGGGGGGGAGDDRGTTMPISEGSTAEEDSDLASLLGTYTDLPKNLSPESAASRLQPRGGIDYSASAVTGSGGTVPIVLPQRPAGDGNSITPPQFTVDPNQTVYVANWDFSQASEFTPGNWESQYPGRPKGSATAVFEKLDKSGEVTETFEVPMDQSTAGRGSYDLVDISELSYGTVSLPVGYYRATTKEDPGIGYLMRSGSNEQILREQFGIPPGVDLSALLSGFPETPEPPMYVVTDVSFPDNPARAFRNGNASLRVTVENRGGPGPGTVPVTVAGTTRETGIDASIPPGGSRTVTVDVPLRPPEDISGGVEVGAGDITQTLEPPEIPADISFVSLDVPEEPELGASLPVEATLRNTGGQSGGKEVPLTVNGEEAASKSVTVSEGETVTETFDIQVPGPQSPPSALNIAIPGGPSTRVTLPSPPTEPPGSGSGEGGDGSGPPAGPTLNVGEPDAPPGTVQTGDDYTVLVPVGNTGDAPGAFEANAEVPGVVDTITVEDGATGTFELGFTAREPGTKTHDITVRNPAKGTSKTRTVTVEVEGEGEGPGGPDAPAPPDFDVQPPELPDEVPLEQPFDLDFDIENVGGEEGQAIVEAFDQETGVVVPPGESRTATLSFTPTVPGTFSRTFTVRNTSTGDEQTFDVSAPTFTPGRGGAPGDGGGRRGGDGESSFSIQRTTAPDAVEVGETFDVTATVRNTGSARGDVTVEMEGRSKRRTVTAGSTTTVTETFTKVSPGPRTIDVTVTNVQTDAAQQESVTVNTESPDEVPEPEPEPDPGDDIPPAVPRPPGGGDDEDDRIIIVPRQPRVPDEPVPEPEPEPAPRPAPQPPRGDERFEFTDLFNPLYPFQVVFGDAPAPDFS